MDSSSLVYLIPGLIFFSLNKVLLAYYNSQNLLKLYASANFLRALFLIGYLYAIMDVDNSGNYLVLIFSFAELSLLIILTVWSINSIFSVSAFDIEWVKKHLIFGSKSVIGSVFIDINTKIDILMLGAFDTNRIVGIYSYPALIIEGFNQIPIVFRTVLNPRITQTHANEGNDGLKSLIKKSRNMTYLILTLLGLFIVLLFPIAINLLELGETYLNGIIPLAILMAGTLISIGYAPILMTLNQLGFPGAQSILYIIIFVTNVLLNLILIPIYSMIGAAIATGLSAALTMLFIKIFVRKLIGIRV